MSSLVGEFRKRMAATLASRSNEPAADVWPAPVVSILEGNFLSHRYLLPRLGESLEASVGAGLSVAEVARQIRFPSRIVQLLYLFLERPRDEVEGRERLVTAERLLGLVAVLRQDDAFCESGGNRVLDAEQFARGYRTWVKGRSGVDPAYAKAGAKLTFLMSNYCELLYFAWLTVGREIHGTYSQDGDRATIVRDYYDLKPPHWSFAALLPFDNVSLWSEYEGAAFRFDFVGRMMADRSLHESLTNSTVVVDGSILTGATEVNDVAREVERVMEVGRQEVMGLAVRQLLLQWVRTQFWAAKPILALRPGASPEGDPVPEELVQSILHDPFRAWLPGEMARISKFLPDERIAALEQLFDPADHAKGLHP